MSSSTRVRRGGGGGHFAVGRRRHVPVVDTGCGCRPRRPRLLSALPSFLKTSSAGKTASVPARSAGAASQHSSSSFFPSSSSAASFSSSSNCSNYYSSCHGGYGGAAKQQDPPAVKAKVPVSPGVKRQLTSKKKKMYYVEKKAAAETAETEEEGVGVAVEKESSDPRADFRESMVQMVVETGLCGWDDLRCMLRRLLALNAPRHHAAILTAFAEVCAQLAAPPASSYQHHQYQR